MMYGASGSYGGYYHDYSITNKPTKPEWVACEFCATMCHKDEKMPENDKMRREKCKSCGGPLPWHKLDEVPEPEYIPRSNISKIWVDDTVLRNETIQTVIKDLTTPSKQSVVGGLWKTIKKLHKG